MNEVLTSIFNATTLWLWQATLGFSLLAVLLLSSHRHLLKRLGPRSVYPLWFILPVTICMPLIAQLAGPLLSNNWQAPAVLYSWTTMPAAAVSATTHGSSSQIVAPMIVFVWLTPAALMIAAFVFHCRQLAMRRSSRYKGLLAQRNGSGSSPGISGILTPCLQLPDDFEQRFNRREQRLIVQHELTHWRRHDLHANMVAWFLLACQWFNPLAWLAYRRFRADQELACDAQVLAAQRRLFPENAFTMQVCYANALLAAMQSVSFNAQSRTLWSNPACTHYGIAQGEKAMAQERFNQLTQHYLPRRWPVLVSASLVTLLGVVTLSPVVASGAPTETAQAEAAEAVQPIVRIEPRYPLDAAEQGIEGHVDLSFVINDQGHVTNVEVLDSQPDDVFSAAAVEALERWRYAPQNDLSQRVRLQFALSVD